MGFSSAARTTPRQLVTVKKLSERNPIYQYLESLEIKPKTAVHKFYAANSKRKAIRDCIMLWYSIIKGE